MNTENLTVNSFTNHYSGCPDLFVEDYLGIYLMTYQKALLRFLAALPDEIYMRCVQ